MDSYPNEEIPMNTTNRTALITGASDGLGRALARELAGQGWHAVITARGAGRLHSLSDELGDNATAIAGDVADPLHRVELAGAIARIGRLDLIVNNASRLGPSPMPLLSDFPLDELLQVYETNVVAPLGVLQVALPYLDAIRGIVINISSDAGVEPYEGWGGYGSSKAALDHLTAIFAAEHPNLSVYSFDPGDMRTEMHQAAFPDEDISDRPAPETVVPALFALIDLHPPSGRYVGAQLLTAQGAS